MTILAPNGSTPRMTGPARSTRIICEQIRDRRRSYAPGGVLHLVLEVIAYPDDEAESAGRRGSCTVTLHPDGSIAIDGQRPRHRHPRRRRRQRSMKKPIMATEDLRFFADPAARCSPTAIPAAACPSSPHSATGSTHTNRRLNGSWTQRYEHGLPVTDLGAHRTATAHRHDGPLPPRPRLLPRQQLTADDLHALPDLPPPRHPHHHAPELQTAARFGGSGRIGEWAAGRNSSAHDRAARQRLRPRTGLARTRASSARPAARLTPAGFTAARLGAVR